jgi:hypothetical protein
LRLRRATLRLFFSSKALDSGGFAVKPAGVGHRRVDSLFDLAIRIT